MKKIVALLALLISVSVQSQATPFACPGQTDDVYFSPKGGATQKAVAVINAAKKTVDVMAYQLTSKPIIAALQEAVARGVTVRVVVDRTCPVPTGMDVRVDSSHRIMHHKVILVDSATLVTGSFNFSANAENNNAENLLTVRGCPKLVDQYESNFEVHWGHSK